MKIFSSESVFEHPWSLFTRALWKKYPNPFSPHVLSCDTLECTVDPVTGFLQTTRLMVKKGKLPSWGTVFLNNREAYVIEFSTVDPQSQTMTTVTRNLSYTKLMLVQETCTITAHNGKTNVRTLAEIVSNTGSGWIRSKIEGFGLSRFKKNFQTSSQGVLHVIDILKARDSMWKARHSLKNAIGAALNVFEVSTLGQPFEVVKTQIAAARQMTMQSAIANIWSRGRVFGFYQGLVPWGWIEASTKGSVLLFATSELEYRFRLAGFSPGEAGILGGMGGGLAQAYSTMGFCTFMKTVEVTRTKGGEAVPKSSIQIARDIWAKEGFAGINKGVNAVAVRQMTNWGSRFGLSRIAEDMIRNYVHGNDPDKRNAQLTSLQRILASAIGGGLSCWNQPIEVIRVEMQSQIKTQGRPEKMTILTAAKWIHQNNGFKGFYRGVTPRIGLGIWQTVCMVFGGDYVKAYFNKKS